MIDKPDSKTHNHNSLLKKVTMPKPLIEIKNVCKSYGDMQILNDVSLTIHSGEFLTLLGPSGCGKTTLLRLLSGFERPCRGDIYLNGECVNDVPPQQRDVHTVFQSYALFPHLSVFENVAFALRCQGIHSKEIEQRVHESLDLVQLKSYAKRDIKQLSGGQQQRVAIARAIINRPQVLLLDESLSSLDYILRKSMQYELKQLQKRLNITFVFVTHDQEEALSMSDRIVVFNQGKIEQMGTPRDIYESPTNLYVAKFIGQANVFDISIHAIDEHCIYTDIESIAFSCKKTLPVKTNDKLHLMIRPEDVHVWKQSEVSNTKCMIPGKIVDITYKGSTVDLKVKLPSGKLINASEFFNEDDDKLEYHANEAVWIEWITGWEVLLPYEG